MGCNACKGDEKETEEDLGGVNLTTKGGKTKVKAQTKRDVSNRETRNDYTFENGAIYKGEWIGEERDGSGT
jgi:hypothetical protein